MLIEEKIVEYFSENNLTLATAESCTGGLISKRITDIPGSSSIFGYGLCTYANDAKMKLLGVSKDTLAKFGAVSGEVASEMARGLLSLSDADICVCTTGIAGPAGETDKKPLGLVYLGIASKKFGVKTVELHLGELLTREKIRLASSEKALEEALSEAKRIIEKNI